jgi:hypothetical protein
MPLFEAESRAIAEIDKKIAALEDEKLDHDGDYSFQLFALRSRRNKLASPLCRLPLDVLRHIIDLVVEESHRLYERFLFRYLVLEGGRIDVFAVCDHIRATALASPTLWRCIYLIGRPDWRKICLERSRQCDLVLVFNPEDDPDDRRHDPELLIANVGRAQEVHIHVEKQSSNTKIQVSVLQQHLPRLRTLAYSAMEASPVMLDAGFMGGCTASLTSLSLHVVTLSSSVSFPSLVHLRLQNVTCEAEPAHLLQTLDHSPLLAHLHLNHVNWPVRDDTHVRQVALSHLETLDVRGELYVVATLLRCIPDPSYTCEARIETPKGHLDDSALADLQLQEEVLDRMTCISGDGDPLLIIHYQDFGQPRWTVSQHCTGTRRSFYLSEFCSLQGFQELLREERKLAVTSPGGPYVPRHPLFAAAAESPDECFPHLWCLTIEMNGIAAFELTPWLRARILRGSRLVCLCVSRRYSAARSQPFMNLIEEIVRDQLVDLLYDCDESKDSIDVVWQRDACPSQADAKGGTNPNEEAEVENVAATVGEGPGRDEVLG